MFLSTQFSLCQSSGLKFSAGLASNGMEDMKSLQKYILSTYPVEGRITSSFPPYTSSSLVFFMQLYDQVRVGGGYSYSTTGGKSDYTDYSGNLSTEMVATSHRLGGYLAYTVLGGDRVDLCLFGKVEANLTSLTIESSYSILNYSNRLYNKYRSLSPSGTIGTEVNFKFGRFSLGAEAAYLVDLTGKLKDTDDGDNLLDPADSEKTLVTDWTGWLLQISVKIPLGF